MKILWLSRHLPEDVQKAELKRIFNTDVEIVTSSQQIKTGKEVIDLMQLFGCTDAVVVLPPNILMEVLKEGYEPLRAVMTREINADGSASFSFSHFERVKKIEIITEKL